MHVRQTVRAIRIRQRRKEVRVIKKEVTVSPPSPRPPSPPSPPPPAVEEIEPEELVFSEEEI